MSKPETISAVLSPELEPLGLLIEDVTVIPAGKRRLVRVLVDRELALDETRMSTQPLPPVSLDEIADATRIISDTLDAGDHMGEAAYTLEVSSPGTDRPLTQPRHFGRNVGRLMSVTLEDGTKVTGRVSGASQHAVELTPEQGGKKAGADASAEVVTITYPTITRAVVQVEFARGGDTDADGEDE